ncbi:hypothetical protein AAMO2058_000238000 [Amorphochlora amoebiformis]
MNEGECLLKLKSLLEEQDKDSWGTDVTLKRFLKAREYDVEKAYKMYTNCLKWRRENEIDKIVDNPPAKLETYKKLVASKHHGFDKLGRPIYVERVGQIHYPTLNEYLTLDDLMDIHVYHMELSAKMCAESSKKLGKDVHQGCHIVDLAGMSMHHRHGLAFIQRCAKVDEAYYPETMGKLYIINAPRIFGFFWGICKAWVHPNTQRKIEVISGEPENELRKAIPLHFLPVEFGGKCNCGKFGPTEESKSTSQGKASSLCVPPCNLTEMKEQLKYVGDEYDSLTHMSLQVKAGTYQEVVVEGIDEKKGTHFSWNWKTVSKNIEFAVYCIPRSRSDGQSSELRSSNVPRSHSAEEKRPAEELSRAHATGHCEEKKSEIHFGQFFEEFKMGKEFRIFGPQKMDKHKGIFRPPVHCAVRFEFSNQYSWLTSKTIRHKLHATCRT